MGTSDPSQIPVGRSDAHPILWNGLVSGVLSGALLASIALGKIVWGQDAIWLALGPLVVLAWLVAAYRASRWALGAGVGALTGLVAALIGALIGAVADQVLVHQFLDQWIAHVIAACPHGAVVASCPYGTDPSPQGILDAELQFTITGLVLLPLLGLLCGLVSGFVGAGRGVRAAAAGDDYQPGQKVFRRPLTIGLRQLPGPDLVDSSGLQPPDTPRL